MLHEFEFGYNATESTKNICYMKAEDIADHSTVARWFKKSCLCYKNLSDQASSGGPKTVESEPVFQAIETDQVSITLKIF